MVSRPASKPDLTFASDHSLLVVFGDEISPEIHLEVLRLTSLLLQESGRDILNVHPGYSSVLITFNLSITSPPDIERKVRHLLTSMDSIEVPRRREVEIPVCYQGEFAPDLEHVARHNNLTGAEVIRLHSSAAYVVYFLGFTPGFPYLGGMPKEIATPRRPSPRLAVEAGSVGIAGQQTGVYPVTSPGGWQIIGRTPITLFDSRVRPPTFLQMGDHVRFASVSRADYDNLSLHRAGTG